MSRDEYVQAKSFNTPGGTSECYFIVEADEGLSFKEQIGFLESKYRQALDAAGLKEDSAVFRRLFLSDILNQFEDVQGSWLVRDAADNPVAVSVIQQAPLPRAKAALLAYHVVAPGGLEKTRLSDRHLLVRQNGVRHLWSALLHATSEVSEAGAGQQTDLVFEDLTGALGSQGGNLADHCVRTWIYIKDVDLFYKGMVDSRRHLFEREGLTAQTHFIASTGIEGAGPRQTGVVTMDAYSVLDLRPGQVSYLNDFERMCRTADYGVTFERGTRVAYADRAHLLISGTASIDRRGQVLHHGDVVRQLDRALENVEGLLTPAGATLADMMYLLVYVRDPADGPPVRERLQARAAGVPFIIVQGAVCRPSWLVEVEGVAAVRHDDPALPRF